MTYPSASTWFELPVGDIGRAVKFYEKTLGVTLKVEDCPMTGHKLAVFPYQCPEGNSGCLMSGTGVAPSANSGTTVYLHVKDTLESSLKRAHDGGAKLLVDITKLPDPMGRFAVIEDCEGNRVGLHQFGQAA
ncbi:MAG: VOC family protein [Rhodospirillales bacterium]|nr:MAG: VOC family protein [Rhodospirillales bacterium]